MSTQSLEDFAVHLLAEMLFYDEEFGALGHISLIDPVGQREMYVASYWPQEEDFVIEEASDWESTEDLRNSYDIGYMLAAESTIQGSYATAADAARVLLDLAREKDLQPSMGLLFMDEL